MSTEEPSGHDPLLGINFDASFYRQQLPEGHELENGTSDELLSHYMAAGVHEGLDPALWFSTAFYLEKNDDVVQSGGNPFHHYLQFGRDEGRSTLERLDEHDRDFGDPGFLKDELLLAARELDTEEFADFVAELDVVPDPLVTVIVPNYNHADFLDERLFSIFNQSYEEIEVIILDDASTDDSASVINSYIEKYPSNATFIPNETNSGNVFKQWRKGFAAAKGDLIWICESDDTAELDFLERAVPMFNDMAVMLAFGRVQFVDKTSKPVDGLDAYRERAKSGYWNINRNAPAAEWFREPFAVHNVIPNVGGCLMRRQEVEASIWEAAEKFEVLGDWFLYLQLARGGKIAYLAEAATYFRQHGGNTSVTAFKSSSFYDEHQQLANAIRDEWAVDLSSSFRFFDQLHHQHENTTDGSFALLDHISLDSLVAERERPLHVLIAFLGFHVGGGEVFPIHLANALFNIEGIRVSTLVLDRSLVHEDIRGLLDSRIPVYHSADIRQGGPDQFLAQAGIDLVNSHHIGVEGLFFLESNSATDIPFVSTLHGTYEVSGISQYRLSEIIRNVSHWIYTADKNRTHIDNRLWVDAKVSKLENAMPLDPEPWDETRESLDIGPNTHIYTLVARPIKEKGWEQAIEAVVKMHDAGHDVVLILVGEGHEERPLRRMWNNHPAVRFVGFQRQIHGIMRFTDTLLLPTRFLGESYPLIVLQALQTGTHVIATDAAQIGEIVGDEPARGGILIPWLDDDDAYVAELLDAMQRVLDPELAATLNAHAATRGEDFDMGVLAQSYAALYREITEEAARAALEEKLAVDAD